MERQRICISTGPQAMLCRCMLRSMTWHLIHTRVGISEAESPGDERDRVLDSDLILQWRPRCRKSHLKLWAYSTAYWDLLWMGEEGKGLMRGADEVTPWGEHNPALHTFPPPASGRCWLWSQPGQGSHSLAFKGTHKEERRMRRMRGFQESWGETGNVWSLHLFMFFLYLHDLQTKSQFI